MMTEACPAHLKQDAFEQVVPSRKRSVYMIWTRRACCCPHSMQLTCMFTPCMCACLQGDRERAVGLTVSPLMDRAKQGISRSQVGFFDIVALPLYTSLAQVRGGHRGSEVNQIWSFSVEVAVKEGAGMCALGNACMVIVHWGVHVWS
jgi:hypothetical protein